ncbi:helix-turn-helix domain-containing protein [Chryseobacterium sp. S90]|uniref:helix-turn-helix domain-containing protein n=1 Tax=Chryseobacterium sp. S90 TaxID=3395373 RepID=UPI0039BC7C54
MQKYSDIEIELLSLQIGCTIKLKRLKNGISQEDLGLIIGSNATMIGRIERYETSTSWQNLLKICQAIELDYVCLFKLKSLEEILFIIDECLQYEKKLTIEKENYYKILKKTVKEKFKSQS